MYSYLKAAKTKPRKKSSRLNKLLSLSFLVLGLFLISQAFYPVVGWYIFVMPGIGSKIISPIATAFPALVQASEADSYSPSTWFTNIDKTVQASTAPVKTYTITIPKLKIENANVVVGGDLRKSLVAWPTSAMPGTWGNNIIFGHSELPQFANPKNYSGIFTFLMDLNEGDEIFVDYDGVRFRYQVIDKKVVDPTDIAVLEQRFDSSYLTLITCVPPGTVWKRGIIRAKLLSR